MHLLIAEDDLVTSELLSQQCSDMGFAVDKVFSMKALEEALAAQKYDLVLLDVWLGEHNSLAKLAKWIAEWPQTAFIVLTAHGSFDIAVEAMRCGAAHFFVKPVESIRLYTELAKYVKKADLSNLKAREEILALCGIIGHSPQLFKLADVMMKTKDLDSMVLIQGESGSGKELVARGFHQLSRRSKGPFEAINCAALPPSLVESELFGHAKGAFTDAKMAYPGVFERGLGGTVFLDEVGELPLGVQAKLLRVLQEKVFRPVGSQQLVQLETRVITATNRNLLEMVGEGLFRADLYYRLKVIDVYVPPLRQRKQDIPDLVTYFVQLYCKKFQRTLTPPSLEIMSRLKAYPWPGNIRELQNSIERAVALSDGSQFRVKDFFSDSAERENEGLVEQLTLSLSPFDEEKCRFEKNYLERVLTEASGNVSEAAKLAGKFRSDLYRLINKYQIDPNAFRH